MPRGYPFTKVLCGLIIALAIAGLASPSLSDLLVFSTAKPSPIAALLHPLFNDIVGAILALMSLWWVGRSLESDTSVAKTAIFTVVVALLTSLGVFLGASVLGKPGLVWGSWILAGSMMVVWATRYPRTPFKFFFFVEMEGRWMSLIGIVLAIVSVRPAALSPFALLPLVFAWAYAANKLPFFPYGLPAKQVSPPMGPRGIRAPREGYFDDVKRREKEREERERLRKLFESSMNDEPPKKD